MDAPTLTSIPPDGRYTMERKTILNRIVLSTDGIESKMADLVLSIEEIREEQKQLADQVVKLFLKMESNTRPKAIAKKT